MEAPRNMRDPDARECRCESCGYVDWVDAPIVAPTPGIVCDVCRRSPCPNCDGAMRPTHPYLFANFDDLTNAVAA